MGIYERSAKILVVRPPVGNLLVEALLLQAEEKSLPVEQALRHPGFFPFHIELPAHQLRRSNRFDIHRQRLDVDVVTLAQPKNLQDAVQPGPRGESPRIGQEEWAQMKNIADVTYPFYVISFHAPSDLFFEEKSSSKEDPSRSSKRRNNSR